MGITRLMYLLKEKCPEAVRSLDLKSYTGRIVACDASVSIYQFLISTQHIKTGFGLNELKDNDGNLTGHLLGLFNRSIMLMENGIRPCWVFDGKPPEAKKRVLDERKKNKEKAESQMDIAKEAGDDDRLLKLAGQSVRVTSQMTQDAKTLIRLLGLPCIEAPAEAEAQCAVMCKAGSVYAVATEDMDCLTFGSPVLLKGFSSKEEPVIEVKLDVILEKLNITMEQFIDMCILCGCDYSDSIDGIGPIKALSYIKEHNDIEGVLQFIKEYNSDTKRKKKLVADESFLYEEARKLFKEPEVQNPNNIELKWGKPDYDGLKKFLCEEKGFNPSRIDSAMKRIETAKEQSKQGRLENFFQLKPATSSGVKPGKRPNEDKKTNTTKKKSK